MLSRKRKVKKGGIGNYKEDDLNNVMSASSSASSKGSKSSQDSKGSKGSKGSKQKARKYIVDKDESTDDKKVTLDDPITMGKIRQDRAILVNGRVYDVETIFEWIVLNKNKEDVFRDPVSDEDVEKITKKFIEVFGEKKYKKRISKFNVKPVQKPTAVDNYGYLVDKYPHPEYFVYEDGEHMMEYNVNARGQAVDISGNPVMVIRRPQGPQGPQGPQAATRRQQSPPRPVPFTRLMQPSLTRVRPSAIQPVNPNNTINGFYFDNRNFLVDKYPNPEWFVTMDGDRLAPYIVNYNGAPIDEYGDFIQVIRRNDIPANILYGPRRAPVPPPVPQPRAHSPAGMSPPPSPRPAAATRAASPPRPRRTRTTRAQPAAAATTSPRTSPPAARRTRRTTQPAAATTTTSPRTSPTPPRPRRTRATRTTQPAAATTSPRTSPTPPRPRRTRATRTTQPVAAAAAATSRPSSPQAARNSPPAARRSSSPRS